MQRTVSPRLAGGAWPVARQAELLIEEATDPEHRHQQVLFTPELVVRRSTLDTPSGFPGSR